MKALPDDLAVLGTSELSEQRALRDDELAPLFQRWPVLERRELRRLRTLYTERLRLARYVGQLRPRRGERHRPRDRPSSVSHQLGGLTKMPVAISRTCSV